MCLCVSHTHLCHTHICVTYTSPTLRQGCQGCQGCPAPRVRAAGGRDESARPRGPAGGPFSQDGRGECNASAANRGGSRPPRSNTDHLGTDWPTGDPPAGEHQCRHGHEGSQNCAPRCLQMTWMRGSTSYSISWSDTKRAYGCRVMSKRRCAHSRPSRECRRKTWPQNDIAHWPDQNTKRGNEKAADAPRRPIRAHGVSDDEQGCVTRCPGDTARAPFFPTSSQHVMPWSWWRVRLT